MVLLALVEEVFPLRVPECNGSVGWLTTAALNNILNENLGGSFDYRPFSGNTYLIFVSPFLAIGFSMECRVAKWGGEGC